MTARIGLPPDAKGFKVLDPNLGWTPVTGNEAVENLVTNPRFEHVEPGSTVLRTNYFKDPSATVVDGNLGNIGGTPATIVTEVSTENVHQGTTSYKISTTSDGKFGRVPITVPNSMRINVGEKFTWSYWIYSTRSGTIYPHWEGTKVSDNSYTGGSGGSAVLIPANTWTKVSGIYTATVNVYVGRAGAYNMSVLAGDTIWMDEFLIEKTDRHGEFFCGDTPDALGWSYAWTGTTGASISVAKAAVVELFRNMTPGLAGWTLSSGATFSDGVVTLNTDGSYAQSPLIPVHTIGDAFAEFLIDYQGGAIPSGETIARHHYTSYYYNINKQPIANTQGYTTNGRASEVPLNQWTGRETTSMSAWTGIVLGPDIAYVSLRVHATSVYSPAPVKIRNPTITTGTSYFPTNMNRFEYFDGNTAAHGDYTYGWSGETDASESVRQGIAVPDWIYRWKDTVNTKPHQLSERNGNSAIVRSISKVPSTLLLGLPMNVPVVAGQSCTLAYWVRPSRLRGFRPIVTFDTGSHVDAPHTDAPANVWTEIRATVTVPEGAKLVTYINFNSEGLSTGGDYTDFSKVTFTPTKYTGPYFDGDTSPDINYIYRWTGEPHNSTSIGR